MVISPQRLLSWVLAFCLIIIIVLFAVLLARRPLATNPDEALYIRQAIQDQQAFREGGVTAVRVAVTYYAGGRPPAYRLFAVPVGLAFGTTPRTLRVAMTASFLLTLVLIYLAGRTSAGTTTGVLSVALFGLAAGPFWTASAFGTEATLYPALAALLYALARWLRYRTAGIALLALTTLAVFVGALSKLSFLVVGPPMLAVAIIIAVYSGFERRSVIAVAAAAALGAALAAPWWAWAQNYLQAIGYAMFVSADPRGAQPLIQELVLRLLGPAYTFLFAGLAVFACARWRSLRDHLTAYQRSLVLVCLAGAVPLIVAHAAGANHNTRLITPGLMTLALAAALVSSGPRGLASHWVGGGIVAVLMLIQTTSLASAVLSDRSSQWDWEPLRATTTADGLANPRIGFLGGGTYFNGYSIEYPWLRRGEAVDVTMIWRGEDGPIEWEKIGRLVDEMDVVMTAPGHTGNPLNNEEVDNQHNQEFVERMCRSAAFDGPVTLPVTGTPGVNVIAFVRRLRREVGSIRPGCP